MKSEAQINTKIRELEGIYNILIKKKDRVEILVIDGKIKALKWVLGK